MHEDALEPSAERAYRRSVLPDDTLPPSRTSWAFPKMDMPPEVTCGYLTVPEDRGKPNGRRMSASS